MSAAVLLPTAALSVKTVGRVATVWRVTAIAGLGCGGSSLALAAEEGVEVPGQGFGVRARAVDVGGGAGAEYRQAEDVEPGGAGDHATVVADAAGAVTHGDVQPGVVGPEAGRPQGGRDLPARQVQFQRRPGIDARWLEAVRRRQLIVEPRRGGPLVCPVQEPVHLQVGEGAGVGERPGELGDAVSDAAEAAGDADSSRGERVKVGDCRRVSGELRGGQMAGPRKVINLVVAFA